MILQNANTFIQKAWALISLSEYFGINLQMLQHSLDSLMRSHLTTMERTEMERTTGRMTSNFYSYTQIVSQKIKIGSRFSDFERIYMSTNKQQKSRNMYKKYYNLLLRQYYLVTTYLTERDCCHSFRRRHFTFLKISLISAILNHKH